LVFAQSSFTSFSRVASRRASGVAAARNAGAAAVDSAWIAFLDSDDLWEPTKLAAQMAWLAERPSYRIAQTGERWLDHGRHRNPRAWHRKEERLFPRCLERCLVSPSAVVVRRDLYERLGGFDPFAVCGTTSSGCLALVSQSARRRAAS
jgi:glycosyltransferase involved in cell wall biosynthesis